MRHVWMTGGAGTLTAVGGAVEDYGWLPGVVWLLCLVGTTVMRMVLAWAASARLDRLVELLPVLAPEVQKEAVSVLTTPDQIMAGRAIDVTDKQVRAGTPGPGQG